MDEIQATRRIREVKKVLEELGRGYEAGIVHDYFAIMEEGGDHNGAIDTYSKQVDEQADNYLSVIDMGLKTANEEQKKEYEEAMKQVEYQRAESKRQLENVRVSFENIKVDKELVDKLQSQEFKEAMEKATMETGYKNIFRVTQKNFENEVLKSETPVIVDFYADWCGPCKMMEPVFNVLSEEYNEKMKFGKLNIDSNYELAGEYKVTSIPNVKVFSKGEVIHEFVGLKNKDAFRVEIEEALKKTGTHYKIELSEKIEIKESVKAEDHEDCSDSCGGKKKKGCCGKCEDGKGC